MIQLSEVNGMTQAEFVLALGAIFENSPWVAEAAWALRPFQSRSELHETMLRIIKEMPEAQIHAFFRMHPDLATRLSIGEYSTREQQGAGLDRLSPEEFEEFAAANRQYMERFGFPFIYAVRGSNKSAIWSALQERLTHTLEQEAEEAMRNIAKITSFRIGDLIEE
ncbi:2-oxo-4-hydroxy-4-carboxy-5-ureidoimidazoline decarboxylase [Paenibacillus radicis (ex Gao et al. 2016)]|uniref:2-oxo-4-hydroxy-4-carboxy-5-ureidoimidazoline decarboxylase n=1 Tax=Paenibacillus radicis (ex Gao et al. 2016) TaxID=1737354 RepID=UPI001E3474E1|nr:2-oxo-4-hydroxy-4-carboxy-5-ureidoimidazoline decarboxylase [Paenibacillus radicis (ex Gao et al. 2016)]